MFNRLLEKLADEAAGRWTFIVVNVRGNMPLAQRFVIRVIPDVKVFHHGQEVAGFSGAMTEPDLRAWIDRAPAQIRTQTTCTPAVDRVWFHHEPSH